MTSALPFRPPSGSTFAGPIDALFFFELAVSAFFILVILGLIIFFTIRYRRQSEDDLPPALPTHYLLECGWTLGVLLILLVFFYWGAVRYVEMKRPPGEAMEIHVLGKQWMWKIEHPDGVREIDELHVPVGPSIKLVMASQDVIHSFFIPAFRIKQDVVPGSYSTQWFIADRPGVYHLFCSQYCGTDHSRMIGRVIALSPSDFQAWQAGVVAGDPPEVAGAKLFQTYGCATCHGEHAPTMAGIFGRGVVLQDGSTVNVDEQYLRESILDSTAKMVAGYPPLMPSYRGQITEEQLFDLIAYIKSLRASASDGPLGGPASNPTTQSAAPPSTAPYGLSPVSPPNFPPARRRIDVQPNGGGQP